jgi:hypothetical protein
MNTMTPTIAKGDGCLQSPVTVDKGIGDDYSVATVKRSNITAQTVRESILISVLRQMRNNSNSRKKNSCQFQKYYR